MKICIFCASSTTLDHEYYSAAYMLGQYMATRDHKLVFGGGNGGLMRYAADGVKSKNGKVISIAPNFLCEAINRYQNSDEFLYTDTMEERKALMMEQSDAFIVLPGGLGTLDELFSALTLKQLGQLNKPVVLLNTNGFFDKLSSFLLDCINSGFIGKSFSNDYVIVNDPEEAVKAIEMIYASAPLAKTPADYNK